MVGFLSFLAQSTLISAETPFDFVGGGALHIVGDMGVYVQRRCGMVRKVFDSGSKANHQKQITEIWLTGTEYFWLCQQYTNISENMDYAIKQTWALYKLKKEGIGIDPMPPDRYSCSSAPEKFTKTLGFYDSVVGEPQLFIFTGKLGIGAGLEGVLNNGSTNFIPNANRIK